MKKLDEGRYAIFAYPEGIVSKLRYEGPSMNNTISENHKTIELWDAYNASLTKIENKTLIRGEKIPTDIFHLVCDILVRHTDGTYLLMQRDPRKHYGGMWEATAGGSALAGETPLQCAVRELREETGIVSESLAEVGREFSRETHAVYVEFLCVTDWKKDEIFRLKKWLTFPTAYSMLK